MTDSNKSLARSAVGCKFQPLVPAVPKQLLRSPSMSTVPHNRVSDSEDMITSGVAVYEDLDKYAAQQFSNVVTDYHSDLPMRVAFCDSIYGFCGSFSFLSGELLDIHFMKETVCANVIRSNGDPIKIPLQANLRFGIKYSPNALAEADYKVSKLMEHTQLPKIAFVKDSSHLDSSHVKVQNKSSQFVNGEVLVLQSYISKSSTIECVSLLHREQKSIHKSSKLVLTVNPSQLMIDFVDLKYFNLPLQVYIHDDTLSEISWESKFPLSSTIMSLTKVKTFIASFDTSNPHSTTPDGVKEPDDTIKLHEIFIDVPITVQKVYLLQSERDVLIRKSKFVYDNFRPSQISSKVVSAPNNNWIQTDIYQTMLPHEDRAGNNHWKQATELHRPYAFNSFNSVVIDEAKGSSKHKPPLDRQNDYYYTEMNRAHRCDIKASSCNMSSTLESVNPNICYSSSPNPSSQSSSRSIGSSTLPSMLHKSVSSPMATTTKPKAFTRESSEKDLQLNDPLSCNQSISSRSSTLPKPEGRFTYDSPVTTVTTAYLSKPTTTSSTRASQAFKKNLKQLNDISFDQSSISSSTGSTLPRTLNKSISSSADMSTNLTASSIKSVSTGSPILPSAVQSIALQSVGLQSITYNISTISQATESVTPKTVSSLAPNTQSVGSTVVSTTVPWATVRFSKPSAENLDSKKDLQLKDPSHKDQSFIDSEYITLRPINTTPSMSMVSTSDHESTGSSSNQPQTVTSSSKGSNTNTLLQSVVTTVATSNGSAVNPITSNPRCSVEDILGSTTLMLESISTPMTIVDSFKPTTSYTGISSQCSKEKSEEVSCDETAIGSTSSTQSNESVSSPVTTENSVNSNSLKALSTHLQSVLGITGAANSTLQSVVASSLDKSVNNPKPSSLKQLNTVDSSSSKLNTQFTSVCKSITPPSVTSKPPTGSQHSKKDPLQLQLKDLSYDQSIDSTTISSMLSGSILQAVSTYPTSSTATDGQTSSLLTPNTQHPTAIGDTGSAHILPSTVKSVTYSSPVTTVCLSKPATLSAKENSTKDLQLEDLSCDQVLHLLDELGLSQYKELFTKEKISGGLLKVLDDDIFRKELGISLRLHRIKLLRVIEGKDKLDQYF